MSARILFGKKQGSIFGIIVLQVVCCRVLQENIFMLQCCMCQEEEKQDIVFHNYFIL